MPVSCKMCSVLPSPLTHTREAICLEPVTPTEISRSISAYLEPLNRPSVFVQKQKWLQIYRMHTGQIWWVSVPTFTPVQFIT